MNRTHTRTLATLALLCAMEIVLARFCVIWITNSIKITFEAIPILTAGLLFGPVAGAVVGAVSDILGAGLLSGLGWLPVLTVTPTLLGVMAGLLRPWSGNASPCPASCWSPAPASCWAVCSGPPGG